ncbi:phosphatase PAP2 family protein [Bacteroidota bacterium]
MKNIILVLIIFLTGISTQKSIAEKTTPFAVNPLISFRSEFQFHPGDTLKFNGAYLKSYLGSMKYIMTFPGRWKAKNWLTAGLILGTTAAIYTIDQPVKDFVQANPLKAADYLFSGAELFGNPAFTFPFLAVNYAYGAIFNNQRDIDVSLMGLQSLLISAGFTYILKMGTQRHRPKTGDPYNTWDGPAFSLDYTSFPSGHSSSAWAIMTTIALEFNDYRAVGALAYTLATLTALSRVYENYHWSSDIFLGSAIGYFTARAVYHYHHSEFKKKVSLIPTAGKNFNGLSMTYIF